MSQSLSYTKTTNEADVYKTIKLTSEQVKIHFSYQYHADVHYQVTLWQLAFIFVLNTQNNLINFIYS